MSYRTDRASAQKNIWIINLLKSLIRLTKHSAIYGMGHVLGRSIGFLLLPIHTNNILPDQYAIYVYGYAYLPLIAILYSAGINSAQLKYFLTTNDQTQKESVFSTSFWGTLAIGLFLTVILIALSNPVAQIVFGNQDYGYLVQISCGILIFDALALLLFNILRAEEKSIQFIVFSILNVIVNIILNIIFIIQLKMGIDGIFLANLIASALTFFALIYVTKTLFSKTFSYDLFKELFKFGLPLIPSMLGMVILTVIDRFILRELKGDETAAIYGAGYKLGMFMSIVVTAFRYAWYPFYLSTANDEDAKQVYSKVLTYFMFFCGAIFLVISLFIHEIAQFKIFGFTIFGEEYLPGTTIVPIILASYVFYGVYLNFQIGVYLENKTKYLALTTGLSALLNIIANFLLIPHLGMMGAAYATLIAYIFMAFSLYFLTNKLYPIQYEWLRISKIVVVSVLLFIVATLSYPNKPSLFKLIFVSAYFIVLYFIGFYEKRELSTIKRVLKGNLWQN